MSFDLLLLPLSRKITPIRASTGVKDDGLRSCRKKFPPEIPLLVPGERIGEPEVSLLQVAAGRGFTVHGLNSGRIKVVR